MYPSKTHILSQSKNKIATVRNMIGLLKVNDDSYMVSCRFFFWLLWIYGNDIKTNPLPGTLSGYSSPITSAHSSPFLPSSFP